MKVDFKLFKLLLFGQNGEMNCRCNQTMANLGTVAMKYYTEPFIVISSRMLTVLLYKF